MVAEGTEALAVDGVKAGNIIFDVSTRGHEEILPENANVLYELPSNSVEKQHQEFVIAKAHRENLSLLEINPSYGATCLVLASSIRLFSYHAWLKEYGGTWSGVGPRQPSQT